MRETLIGPGVTVERARAAVASVAPAVGLVERRHDVGSHLSLALADNAQQRAFITGADIELGDLDPADVWWT